MIFRIDRVKARGSAAPGSRTLPPPGTECCQQAVRPYPESGNYILTSNKCTHLYNHNTRVNENMILYLMGSVVLIITFYIGVYRTMFIAE